MLPLWDSALCSSFHQSQEPGPKAGQTQVQISALPLFSCVTLNKSLSLSGPVLPNRSA